MRIGLSTYSMEPLLRSGELTLEERSCVPHQTVLRCRGWFTSPPGSMTGHRRNERKRDAGESLTRSPVLYCIKMSPASGPMIV